jgi:hypothetical protein
MWLLWLQSGHLDCNLVSLIAIWLPWLQSGYLDCNLVTLVPILLPWLQSGYLNCNLVTLVAIWLPLLQLETTTVFETFLPSHRWISKGIPSRTSGTQVKKLRVRSQKPVVDDDLFLFVFFHSRSRNFSVPTVVHSLSNYLKINSLYIIFVPFKNPF